jgi:hypothetical protein
LERLKNCEATQHLISSVCIDVRPARLVERAAAPSVPMLFELRGIENGK